MMLWNCARLDRALMINFNCETENKVCIAEAIHTTPKQDPWIHLVQLDYLIVLVQATQFGKKIVN